MTIRYNHGKLVLFLCLSYILVSPLNNLIPISLNRVITLTFIASEIAFALLVNRRARPGWVLYVLYWTAVGVLSCLTGVLLSEDLSDTVYMLNTVLLLELIIDEDVLEQMRCYAAGKRGVVLTFLFLTLLFIGISALDPEGFEKDGALRGYMYNSHSMASTAVLVMAMAQLCVDARGTKLKGLLCAETFIMIAGTAIILATKGRTFLIPAAVLLWRYLHMLPIVKMQRRVLAVCAAAVLVVVLWDQISIKFIEALNNPYARNTLAAITNFRSELWKCDLGYFSEQGIVGMLFGNSYSFVRELHEVRLTERIWSHNDLTYVLIAAGLVGLAVYLSMYVRVSRAFCSGKKNRLYFAAMVIFPMLVNGFYIYVALLWAFLVMRVSLYARQKHAESR